ncbi:MAG: AMP-binding protein [Desulfurococcales archaeon]|nr:AMP-binding protein [Desulfurococcales archaeon]
MSSPIPSPQESIENFLKARDYIASRPLYDEAVKEFKWPELGKFNWAVQYFDAYLTEKASHPAVIWVDDELLDTGDKKVLTHHRLREDSNRLATSLLESGYKPGDSILVMTGNIPELFTVFLGLLKAGIRIVPATILLSHSDIEDRVKRAGVTMVMADKAGFNKIEFLREDLAKLGVKDFVYIGNEERGGWKLFQDLLVQGKPTFNQVLTNADDDALIYFTSGTTAKPKMVFHTHASYPVGHLTTMYWVGAQWGDKHYNISSPGWAKWAWSTFFTAFNSGATSMVYSFNRFTPSRALKFITEYGVNTLCAPPTVWRMFILEDLAKYNFENLREAVSAGEPLNPKVINKVKEDIGITVREGYGQTETTLQIGYFPGVEVKPGSMGKPAPGYEIVIADIDGKPVKPGYDGQITIKIEPRKPLGLMKGYDSPEKNKEVFRLGLYWTGDVAYLGEDGYLYFVGRADDVFKSSDYRISPFEVESDLLKHPAIAEVAVVPSPHPIKWTVPKAFIKLKPGYKPTPELAKQIFTWAKQNMAPYKRPRIIEFVDELPKTISGKIRRVELRALERTRRQKGEKGPHEYFEEDFKTNQSNL